jgi:hypothetical protein
MPENGCVVKGAQRSPILIHENVIVTVKFNRMCSHLHQYLRLDDQRTPAALEPPQRPEIRAPGR